MKKIPVILFAAFFAFILWVIYMANTGRNSIFFDIVASIPYGDKLGHFLLFGMLTLFANVACKLKYISVANMRVYYGAILVFTFAAIEEMSQGFIASRTMDVTDLIFDLLGIMVFSLMCYYYQIKMETKAALSEDLK